MNELEYALDNIDSDTFEEFAMDFLRAKDYTVHESGKPGYDGGWDARIEIGGRTGIAHASIRSDKKRKIREDADKIEQLEKNKAKVTTYTSPLLIKKSLVNKS